MGEGSSNVTGVDVDGLHGTGRKIAGRSEGARAAARGLSTGLDSASGTVGHGRIKSALSSFVTDHLVDDSNQLGVHLDTGGNNVSNVASTARSNDEEGARALQADIGLDTEIGDRINRQV
ncbi:hypothetical protein ASD11_16410 [Aeromicrobium sp. Root495]|uniref:hypothetical protein n=1 Tax=Aeromicrobium sp. Root495 TaxID=1736550 RepID=UPI0006FF44D8|nr:hypothetical protein [Aeromicrobium sp. Root495]KQY56052.1 hypothetical protein ASD11_16410 [Aeromicrobium sp. Root495]RYI99824.1 MAG: hypothetical protein EON52_25005 [Actinomycetales bacterium]